MRRDAFFREGCGLRRAVIPNDGEKIAIRAFGNFYDHCWIVILMRSANLYCP